MGKHRHFRLAQSHVPADPENEFSPSLPSRPDFMTNANEDTTSSYGKRSQIASTACPSPPSVSSSRDSSPLFATNVTHSLILVDEKIFCCHGGLSPDLQSMEQIRRIMRPTDVPDQGLLCDLLWSDPDKDTMGWGENDRGVSFTFGAEV